MIQEAERPPSFVKNKSWKKSPLEDLLGELNMHKISQTQDENHKVSPGASLKSQEELQFVFFDNSGIRVS